MSKIAQPAVDTLLASGTVYLNSGSYVCQAPYNVNGVARTPAGDSVGDITITFQEPFDIRDGYPVVIPINIGQFPWIWSITNNTLRVKTRDIANEPIDGSFAFEIRRNRIGGAFVAGQGVGTDHTYDAVFPVVALYPQDGVTDDWPRLQAAMIKYAYKATIVMKSTNIFGVPTHWVAQTPFQMPSGTHIYCEPGVYINSTMGPGAFDHFVFWKFAQLSNTVSTTIAAFPAPNQIRVNSAVGFAVGDWIWVGQTSGGAHDFLSSQYQITAAAGATFTLDRMVLFPFSVNDPVRKITDQCKDIILEGNGAIIDGAADRAIEFTGAYHCHIDNWTLLKTGATTFTNAISLDISSLESTISNCKVRCPGVSDCLMLESSERCQILDSYADVVGAGITLFDCVDCVAEDASSSIITNTGIRLTSNLMTVGCFGCIVRGGEFSDTLNVGVSIEYGADNLVEGTVSDTCAVGFDTGAQSTRLRLLGTKSKNCTTYGVQNRTTGTVIVEHSSVSDVYGFACFAGCDLIGCDAKNFTQFGIYADPVIPAGDIINVIGGRYRSSVGGGTGNRFYGPAFVNFNGVFFGNDAGDASQSAIILIGATGAIATLQDCKAVQSSASNGLVVQAGTTARLEGRIDFDALTFPVINGGSLSQGQVVLNGVNPVNVAFPDLKSTDTVLFSLNAKAGTGTGLAPIVVYTPTVGFSVTSVAGDTSVWNWSVNQ